MAAAGEVSDRSEDVERLESLMMGVLCLNVCGDAGLGR